MKQNKLKNIFYLALQERAFSIMFLMVILMTIVSLADAIINIESSKVLVWIRSNSFDLEGYHRAEWYYFYLWPLLAIISAIIHLASSIKFIKSYHRNMAIFILFLGLIIQLLLSINFNLLIGLDR